MPTKTRSRPKNPKVPQPAPPQSDNPVMDWDTDFNAYLAAQSPPKLRSGLSAQDAADAAHAKHPVVTKPEYCLVISPANGEWPLQEIFPDVDSMARRIRELEGQEMNLFPYFGIPVPYTRGPWRFLQLPNGQLHPVFDTSVGTFVLNPEASLPIDTCYFISEELRHICADIPVVIDHRPAKAANKKEQADKSASSKQKRNSGRRAKLQ